MKRSRVAGATKRLNVDARPDHVPQGVVGGQDHADGGGAAAETASEGGPTPSGAL